MFGLNLVLYEESRFDRARQSTGWLAEALRHHLVGVLAEIGRGEDALELMPHQRLTRRVVPMPCAERLNEAGRRCRIERIEGDDLISEKGVASADVPGSSAGGR